MAGSTVKKVRARDGNRPNRMIQVEAGCDYMLKIMDQYIYKSAVKGPVVRKHPSYVNLKSIKYFPYSDAKSNTRKMKYLTQAN